jgi:hypothetical protein
MKNNPWAEMDKLMAEETVSRKDGWFSMQDFADNYKCPRSTARSRIESWLASGAIEKKAGVVADGKRGTYYRHAKKSL